MLNGVAIFALCGCVSLLDAPVETSVAGRAQVETVAMTRDCAQAETQTDMTLCAGQDLELADKALNQQYRVTRDAMRKRDADAVADKAAGAEDALVTAQRAWVNYRDAQCTSFGFQAHGGTMEPMLVAQCKADLSRNRTQALKVLADGVGN
ncbi:MAG: lysozyme inhibitor LprI family protein [Neorhizobium sp.]|nr:lysozyme inhibitor LprI family protein [Neorhizobium sp.]